MSEFILAFSNYVSLRLDDKWQQECARQSDTEAINVAVV